MKPIYVHLGGALALTFTIAACVPAPDSTPAPTPTPTPVATRPPVVIAQPAPENWMDVPATPGDWSYAEGRARFAEQTQGSDSKFILECRGSSVRLYLKGSTSQATPVTIRTESLSRTLNADTVLSNSPPTGPNSAPNPTSFLFVDIPARDPLLDAMALTKGRFAVDAAGVPTLYLPAWAEVTRVIEDCR